LFFQSIRIDEVWLVAIMGLELGSDCELSKRRLEMIHQHHHLRHLIAHYIPYIILAIAAIALVVLLANMIIPQILTAPVSKVVPPAIPQQESASINFTGELDSQSLGVAGGGFILNRASLLPPKQQSMSAADRYGYNLTGEVVPGGLKTSSGFRGDAIPYQAKPWLLPEVRQGFRADAIPYQAKPWLQPAIRQGFRADAIPYQAKPWLEPLTTEEMYGYNYFKQHLNNDR
jgi:hypothetical protein